MSGHKRLKKIHKIAIIASTIAATTAILPGLLLHKNTFWLHEESATSSPQTSMSPIINTHPSGNHIGPDYLYPDSNLTPGVTNPSVTQENINQNICNPNWSTKSIRPPVSYTNQVKLKELSSGYTYNGDTNPADYELDHLIALTDGGNPTSEQNLWPEPYHTQVNGIEIGARQKDLVEVQIHKEICSGVITLARGQDILSHEWYGCWVQLRNPKTICQ